MQSRFTPTAVTLLAAFAITGCPGDQAAERAEVPQAQVAFFESIRELCGEAYPGTTQFSAMADSPLADARLVMHVETCTDSVIRIPFAVDEDHSRTWVLTLTSRGLLLKHDHRHEDGTPHDTTNYGGWATDAGTPAMQHFPADEETARMIPPASTNVWTLIVDTAQSRFAYDLERDGAPRYRAEFDLATPVTPPRRP